jgi:hypothetical protein
MGVIECAKKETHALIITHTKQQTKEEQGEKN